MLKTITIQGTNNINHIICFNTEKFAYFEYSVMGANILAKIHFQGAEPIQLDLRTPQQIEQLMEIIKNKDDKEMPPIVLE